MKTQIRNYFSFFIFFCIICNPLSSQIDTTISQYESDALMVQYGYPANTDFSYCTSGGCYSTEGAPLPWGQFNGIVDRTFFVGGDCLDFELELNVCMASGDRVLIYELDDSNNLVVTAVINGNGDFLMTSYCYKHFKPNREAFVYVRVLKVSDDTPDEYVDYDTFYMFRGIWWMCYR